MMPCCWAAGCSNNEKTKDASGKVMRFVAFPKDSERRRLWSIKVSRQCPETKTLLIASNSSLLCHDHFDENQYEPRIPGKLRRNAVPTLFKHKVEKTRKPPAKRSASPPSVFNPLFDHGYSVVPEKMNRNDTQGSICGHSANGAETFSDEETDVEGCSDEVNGLRRELAACKYQLQKRQDKLDAVNNQCSKVFNPDQLASMTRKGSQGMKWSNETIQKALQLKFSCGTTGYEVLLAQHHPLPSIRTLQRRMEAIDFSPGILHSVFELLKLKAANFHDKEKLCSLTLDEMAIADGLEYDKNLGALSGKVTLPGHSGLASHLLVFMLSDVTTRWKQVVAYYWTGRSTNGEVYKEIIWELIELAHKVGLKVINVTSDMGSSNQALWRTIGIEAKRSCVPRVKIRHPQDSESFLYFLPDVPHLIKNIKASLLAGNTICYQDKIISIKPVIHLAKLQEDRPQRLKLAPKLDLKSLTERSHFGKMKVASAMHVFSHSVAQALLTICKMNCVPVNMVKECQDTAWFLDLMNHWFDLMASRHFSMALSKSCSEQYQKAREHLQRVVDVFQVCTIGFGERRPWKPVQTGVILATTAILELSECLLDDNVSFLMTGRLTQDCLENLFSVVRTRNPVPSCVEARNVLKTISVAQFIKSVKHSSYDSDESEFLANYLDNKEADGGQADELEEIEEVVVTAGDGPELDRLDKLGVYHLAGWCLKSTNDSCTECKEATQLPSPAKELALEATFTVAKEYKKDALRHPTVAVYHLIEAAERTYLH